MVTPHYNYDSVLEGQPSPQILDSQWLHVRKALAAQILKSNEDVYHAEYSDQALTALKSAELEARIDSFKASTIRTGLISWIREAFHCISFWLIFKVTKGGASVARLIEIALIAIPLYALALSFSAATFQGKPCHLNMVSVSAVIEQISRASSLFFAIGYTGFVGSSALEAAVITVAALVGLIWYALFAAVIIRRVYR
jgi:hypothetical protein